MAEPAVWAMPGALRVLQLALAAAWLFDAVLQLQPFMFSPAFGRQMLAATATGNPAVLARSIIWATGALSDHAVVAGSVFAGVQLSIGVLIAWRPGVKLGLALSIPWSLAVWWVGEGFGGVFTRTANPLAGAPGAVVIYALLAVLLWPSETVRQGERCLADRLAGPNAARLAWLVLWVSMAYFAVLPANRVGGLGHSISDMEPGEPGWLSGLDRTMASLFGHGAAPSIVLAVALAACGLGVFLPTGLRRAALVLSAALALLIWVVGEAFGGIFAGAATDPNSGPLLILLAVAYWPAGWACRFEPAHSGKA